MSKISEEEIQKILPIKGPSFQEVKNFLEKYNNEYIVIKCGGSVLIDKNLFNNFINDISILNKLGFIPVVIHGGGKRISNKLNDVGIKSNFINGLRVTDQNIINIVEKVLIEFNKDIGESLNIKSSEATQINSKKSNVINVVPENKELGFVGIPKRINTEIIEDLIRNNKIPVVAPLGLDEKNQVYNINGDTAAGAIAKSLKSRRLLLMTNVEGVLDKEKKDTAGAIRKMAAIFAADVVGYSKLMASNEKLTLFRLKETRKITDKIIHQLNGRIFSTAGDSIMAEFASPVDAMEAAISIQKEVSKKAKEIQDNITIEFRIGINLGDIMTQDNNLYGDNVNIAARLEAIAPVGEITVSEKVYSEVEDKVDVTFKYQGEKKLKNISKKIKVYTSQITTDKKKSVKFQKKPYIIAAIIALFMVVGGVFYFLNNKSSNDIEYTDNSKSVLESFRTDQEGLPTNNNASSNIVFVALMEFQNQSKVLTGQKIENISKLFSEKLFEEEKISIVKTPQGSENLNPPEVMLIATESNASFVVNGIISDENNSSFLNLKIYEAKRGSLIINQKISVDENNSSLIDFTSNFKKDILKK